LKQAQTEREYIGVFDFVVLKHRRDSTKKETNVLTLEDLKEVASKNYATGEQCICLPVSIHFFLWFPLKIWFSAVYG